MKQVISILMLGGILGGCTQLATVENAATAIAGITVTPQQADIAASAFDGLEQTATQYESWPVCTKNVTLVCKNPSVIPALNADILAGQQARNRLEQAAISTGGPSASLYNVLVGDINTLQTLFTQYNIGTPAK
jgi:hypothetical protein